MVAWKFIIPTGQWVTAAPGMEFSGCVAVVTAETEDAARGALKRYASENGLDARWVEVAQVRRLEPVEGSVLAWVQL